MQPYCGLRRPSSPPPPIHQKTSAPWSKDPPDPENTKRANGSRWFSLIKIPLRGDAHQHATAADCGALGRRLCRRTAVVTLHTSRNGSPHEAFSKEARGRGESCDFKEADIDRDCRLFCLVAGTTRRDARIAGKPTRRLARIFQLQAVVVDLLNFYL